MIVCELAAAKVVEQVACPVEGVTATPAHPLMVVPPSLKVIVPVEESATGLRGVTLAVNVTCWFTPVDPEVVTATVGVALFTVCEKDALVLPLKLVVSPE